MSMSMSMLYMCLFTLTLVVGMLSMLSDAVDDKCAACKAVAVSLSLSLSIYIYAIAESNS